MSEPKQKRTETKDRRAKYIAKMKSLGFKKIQIWVHENDRSQVLEFIDNLRNKRVNKVD